MRCGSRVVLVLEKLDEVQFLFHKGDVSGVLVGGGV